MRVLYCDCTYSDVLPSQRKREVLHGLCGLGIEFDAVPDLCKMSARKDPAMKGLAGAGNVRIAACFPRAVKWLFHAGGAPLTDGQAEVLNMRTQSAEQTLERLRSDARTSDAAGIASAEECHLRVVLYEGPGTAPIEADQRCDLLTTLLGAGHQVTCCARDLTTAATNAAACVVVGRFDKLPPELPDGPADRARLRFIDMSALDSNGIAARINMIRKELGVPQPGTWVPWFPVIDYDRCGNCQQCVGFCLFGVFGMGVDGRVEVQKPENCKTGCPACSRVCPNVAIMFPKYENGPVNGDEVTEEQARSEPVQVDISGLLGGDIQASLRTRSRDAGKRFSPGPKPSDVSRISHERLKEAQKELGIPDKVMHDLGAADRSGVQPERATAPPAEREEHGKTEEDRQPPAPREEWDV